MTLPFKPMIAEAVLRRGLRPYQGSIHVGKVFAWEPDLPYVRELCIVTKVEGDQIWSAPLAFPRDPAKAFSNDEYRFREAVVETWYKDQEP